MSALSFNRTELLLGADVMQKLADTRVIVFGIGGVGSWCAESLVRTGVGHITIVDADTVATSNINRQLPATTSTVGEQKTEVMKRHLLDINPELDICARAELYTAETAHTFPLTSYDYVIDAIDSLTDKAMLINAACDSRSAKLFSSMGAALKLHPDRIKVDEFWNVKGCPLAAALRNKFKRSGRRPSRKFKCVYSDELIPNAANVAADTSGAMTFGKKRTNGALCHITAMFGLTLTSLVVDDIVRKCR